ncbi:amino acid/amide ABC transporter membrane protein 2, HAAT family [Desulfosporosinus acidiphilus SJ4]|uniref:Amino acid/amide ABC transporter membrane protein 2, HAAT family n=1 Tax=Desulfosporosinus acidiphilus (strain DSM 22704 / JCM 16185 / SJ4) TaxID=646529 RepID=I4D2J7_DESAJ|nr:branched-chain amino acid ABC transporter permease [Desulfosporosinus acidiphilus]AFM40021.1 amino acid/amide ABC transporter membrane protein 2, HAAT family [Desulfosporosinus acidiphilus SJ4]
MSENNSPLVKTTQSKIPNLLGFGLAMIGIIILLFIPTMVPPYYSYLLATIFTTALLATSLNLVLGYGGLLHLHHGVFYGIGAYTVAVVMTKTTWPFAVAVILGPILAAVAALVIGWFCVRLRGLYFGMLTLALGQLVWAIVYRWNALTNGDNGIHAVPVPDFLTSINSVYYTTLLVLLLSLVILYLITKSPFGLTLLATRDNPVRSESIGINVKQHRLIAFVIAGFFAGVAGVLFVLIERSVAPSLLFWSKSAEILIMCLMGGLTVFLGPTLGAAILVLISMIVGLYTEYWLLVLGFLLLILVLFLPQGILGFVADKIQGQRQRGESSDAPN